MKKLNPALSVLGSVSMALTLASPTLADVKQPNPESTVEMFKEDANAKPEDKNFMYGSDGKVGRLITEKIDMTNNDWDKDGISNDLESNGYKIEFNPQTGKREAKAWDPEKDKEKPKFISNPMNANTDGDPFDDMYEVEKYENGSETNFNPIVANMPNLQIGVNRIEIIPIATITDNNGGSISRGWEKSVATQHSFNIGASGEGGAEVSAAGPVPSGKASVNVGYGYSKTTTETENYTNNFDWSTATTVDTAKAAKVRVHLEYKNVGTAGAENVSPHFNIRLGNKIINTVKATQDRYKANYLSTAKGGRNTTEVVIDSLEGQADANIFLSLDELKAVEHGELLSVEVLPTSTMGVSVEKDGEYMSAGDSGRIEARVNAATEQLETDIGNIPKFKIYTPKDKTLADKQVLSYNEVLKHIDIDTNKVKHIVNKAKSNNRISVVSDKKLSDLKTRKDDRGYLHKDDIHGAFENIKQPTVVESSYDDKAQKIRTSILPGLFGLSNEIDATYGSIVYTKREGLYATSGERTKVKLVKRQNGYTYESSENIHPVNSGIDVSEPVILEINDAQNLAPKIKTNSVLKYNKKFEDYVADTSGEYVVEGTPYNISGSDYSGSFIYWGNYKGHNRWEYLSSSNGKVNVIIERVGQPKPGQPIKKDEEVFIKYQNSWHSGYSYLKLQDSYIHLDQKQNASTFKFSSNTGGIRDQKEWKIKSGGNTLRMEYVDGYIKYNNSKDEKFNWRESWQLSKAK